MTRLFSALRRGFDTERGRALLALMALLLFQALNNWVWLSLNVTIGGHDVPANLRRSLIYSDMLARVNLTSFFKVLSWHTHRPPAFFLSAIPLYRAFGSSADVATMTNVLYMVVLLWAVYGIGEIVGDRRAGLLSAFAVSTFPAVFAISRLFYVEYALTAVVALSVYLLLRSRDFEKRISSLFLGVSLGWGMLIKWTFPAFVLGPLCLVTLRSGVLAQIGRSIRKPTLDKRWAGVAVVAGLLVTLIWYLPNEAEVPKLLLGRWLFIISWLLLALTIYFLSRPPSREMNCLSALFLGVLIASSWYLPNVDFLREFLGHGSKTSLAVPSSTRYLRLLMNYQLSFLYFSALIVVVSAVAWVDLSRFGLSGSLRRLKGDAGVIVSWLLIPLVIFTLLPTITAKHTIALLPSAGVIIAYGILRIRRPRVKATVVSFLVMAGMVQFFILSYDTWAWIPERTSFNLPFVGRGNLFAQGGLIKSPNRGGTDSGYWILPDVLDEAAERGVGGGRDEVRFAVLVDSPQINHDVFGYLAYGRYPPIVRQRFRSGEGAPPPQEQVFAADYLLFKSGSNEDMIAEKRRALALARSSPFFDIVFVLVKRYYLPNGEEVYLYKKRYYMREGYNPEDYRGVGEWLREGSGQGDGVVIVPPEQAEALARYLWGDIGIYPLPREGTSVEEVEEELAEIVSGHGRIFGIFWDEGGVERVRLVEGWLNGHGYEAWDRWYGGVRLVIYGTSLQEEGPYRPLRVRLGDKIILDGYRLIDPEIGTGDIVRLTLHWNVEGEVEEDYKVFVHLLDKEGRLVAQRDSEPQGGRRPTSGWGVGEEMVDRHGVLVGEDTPFGRYEIVVGMYEPESGERLPIVDESGVVIGDKVSLGMVEVVDG